MASIQFERTERGAFVHCPASLGGDLDFHLRCKDVGTEERTVVSVFNEAPERSDTADEPEMARFRRLPSRKCMSEVG